jgi:NADPH:quinone reductase-like Zn-dependent oxidoreductase
VVFVGAHGDRRPLRHIAALKLASLRRKRELIFFITKSNNQDLQMLADMLESGQVKPAIDRMYRLVEAEQAFRTLGEGHVGGKLVLTI